MLWTHCYSSKPTLPHVAGEVGDDNNGDASSGSWELTIALSGYAMSCDLSLTGDSDPPSTDKEMTNVADRFPSEEEHEIEGMARRKRSICVTLILPWCIF